MNPFYMVAIKTKGEYSLLDSDPLTKEVAQKAAEDLQCKDTTYVVIECRELTQ